MTHSDSKIVTARKPHTCDDCNGKINIGDKYRFWKSVVFKEEDCEKYFNTWKYCPSCEQKHQKEIEEQQREIEKKIKACEDSGGHEFLADYSYSYDSYGVGQPEKLLGYFCKKCGTEKQ